VSATAWKRIQMGLTIAWAILLIPSVLWWKSSILWIIAMSCYANVAASGAAWMAARGDENAVGKSDLEPIRDALRTLLADQAVLLDRVAPVEVDQPDT
jgi:hypothetical protein